MKKYKRRSIGREKAILALNFDGIAAEILGEKQSPSLEEIMNLIPAEKRLIIEIKK